MGICEEQFLQRVLQALGPVFQEFNAIDFNTQARLVRKAASRYFMVGRPFKWCPCCKRTKERDEFGADRSRYDQLTGVCRECRRK